MMVYRKRSTQPFKWILALIIFVFALTVTFDAVEGINLPTNKKSPVDTSASADQKAPPPRDSDTASVTYVYDNRPVKQQEPPPTTSIPEPTTLLLVAGGLGAMYLIRRRKR